MADATTANLTRGELKGTVAGAFKSSGSGSPSQAISLASGTLRLANSAATNFGGDLTYSSGSLVLDRTISGAANTDTMGALSIGAVTLQPTTTNYTSAPTVVFGATTLTGNAIFDTTYANITLGAVGDGGGGCTITARAAGTLTLSASNTYGGGTTLSAGQLDFNNSSAIGTGPFTINGGTLDNTSGGTLTNLNNNPQNWNASFAFLGSNNLNLGTGTVALNNNSTVTVGSNALVVGGAIGGTGSLSKAGNGTLELSGSNGYSGGTTILAGTLQLGNTAALGSATSSLLIARERSISTATALRSDRSAERQARSPTRARAVASPRSRSTRAAPVPLRAASGMLLASSFRS